MLPGNSRATIAVMLAGWLMEVSATPSPGPVRTAAPQKLQCGSLDSQTRCKSLMVSTASSHSEWVDRGRETITTKELQQPQQIKSTIKQISFGFKLA